MKGPFGWMNRSLEGMEPQKGKVRSPFITCCRLSSHASERRPRLWTINSRLQDMDCQGPGFILSGKAPLCSLVPEIARFLRNWVHSSHFPEIETASLKLWAHR
jgi:hypothetical protein